MLAYAKHKKYLMIFLSWMILTLIGCSGTQEENPDRSSSPISSSTLSTFKDNAELEQRAGGFRRFPGMADMPLESLMENLGSRFRTMIAGTPDEVADRLRQYADSGVTEIMIHWFDLDDVEGLRLLAEHVVPAFT